MLRIAQVLATTYLLLVIVVVALGFRPPPEPVTVTMLYGTEKEDWLEAAAQRFAESEPTTSSGSPINIELEGMGSREMALDVAMGELQPTVISPASSIHTELLRDEWATRNNGAAILHEGSDAPVPLVITPLVIVAWEERAEVLGLGDPDELWPTLHELLSNDQGWGAFGQPDWGLARWGHTNPETSNSGVQTIVLLAYAYHNKETLEVDDILDPGFTEWFDDFEEAVPEFPSSTGFLMTSMLQFGPSQYSFIVVYENLAIDNVEVAEGRGGAIRVFYPPANIQSDHPYAILNAPWVTPDQREAAAMFRDFLLSNETQELALDFGFRPANPGIEYVSHFSRYEQYGIQADIERTLDVPPARVINELIDRWRRGDYD